MSNWQNEIKSVRGAVLLRPDFPAWFVKLIISILDNDLSRDYIDCKFTGIDPCPTDDKFRKNIIKLKEYIMNNQFDIQSQINNNKQEIAGRSVYGESINLGKLSTIDNKAIAVVIHLDIASKGIILGGNYVNS